MSRRVHREQPSISQLPFIETAKTPSPMPIAGRNGAAGAPASMVRVTTMSPVRDAGAHRSTTLAWRSPTSTAARHCCVLRGSM